MGGPCDVCEGTGPGPWLIRSRATACNWLSMDGNRWSTACRRCWNEHSLLEPQQCYSPLLYCCAFNSGTAVLLRRARLQVDLLYNVQQAVVDAFNGRHPFRIAQPERRDLAKEGNLPF